MHVALLRGVNVGGNNRLPMKDLAAMFEDAACTDVRTFIQSGNVVFAAPARLVAKIPAQVGGAIRKRFGFEPAIMIRSAEDLARVARGNPFLAEKIDPDELHVGFLGMAPDAKCIAALDPKRSPPDQLVVKGSEIYFRFPNGIGRTKLTTAYVDRILATQSTVRNWRTVTKLLELCGAA